MSTTRFRLTRENVDVSSGAFDIEVPRVSDVTEEVEIKTLAYLFTASGTAGVRKLELQARSANAPIFLVKIPAITTVGSTGSANITYLSGGSGSIRNAALATEAIGIPNAVVRVGDVLRISVDNAQSGDVLTAVLVEFVEVLGALDLGIGGTE